MTNFIFSIIIPVYNGQEWIADAIESSIKQPFSEVIVVNDGSTDNSLAIAQKYASEANNMLVVNQINKGLASARNAGIMNAKGEWIIPLDADDMLMDDAIMGILQFMSVNPGFNIYGLSFKEFGESNSQVILMESPTLDDFRTGNRLGYCSVINKQTLLKVGGYNPKMLEGYEDLALWCDLLNRGEKVLSIQIPLWLYRIRPNSMYKQITPSIHEKLITQINRDIPDLNLNF